MNRKIEDRQQKPVSSIGKQNMLLVAIRNVCSKENITSTALR